MKIDFPLLSFFKKLEKKQKVVLIILSAVLLFDVVFAIVKFSSKQLSPSDFVIEGSDQKSERIYGLNSNAKKGKISKSGYAFYEFTKQQREVLYNFYVEGKAVNFTLRIGVKGAGTKIDIKKKKIIFFILVICILLILIKKEN